MKFINRSFSILITFIFLLQCSPKLNYLGNRYSPTNKVIIFFDATEIKETYTIMGLLNFNFEPSVLNQKENFINELVLSKAKEVGADAVLITNFSNEVYSELTEDILSKKIVTQDTDKVFVEAKFLKFKK